MALRGHLEYFLKLSTPAISQVQEGEQESHLRTWAALRALSPVALVGNCVSARTYDAPDLHVARIMLDPRDWNAIFEPYASEPTLALALAFQFTALKHSLQRGPKGIAEAITGMDQAIEHLYPHTEFNTLGRRVFSLTIESTITGKQEDLITALKKSFCQSECEPIVKPDNRTKQRPQISLVKPGQKPKRSKNRKAS